ncbi:MAG: DAK2 domain-containing protein [Dehalococcoidia bacterium]|nr:DAK2 domain-containing protein [Dehalococcoidia bacterium]
MSTIRTESIDGKTFRKMFTAGTHWLERAVPGINAINVFPVPDGDTGTNMLLTMRSAVEEGSTANGSGVGAVARAMAYGALMGARGNSGVILSQVWRGIADSLEGQDSVDGAQLAAALEKATATAYAGLVHPVEGTILTVLRESSAAARAIVDSEETALLPVLECIVNAARDSVASTPELLPVLKEAGVVDAGAQGLYVLLDGALASLNGRSKDDASAVPTLVAPDVEPAQTMVSANTKVEIPYGYCTNFVLEGKNIDVDRLTKKLTGKGQSLVIASDGDFANSVVRVHVHTFNPGDVLQYATKLGTLHQVEIHNMDDQYQEFMQLQKSRAPQVDTAIVTIASGDGMFDIFNSLGATVVVPGGQTMNPSVRQLADAVDLAPSDNVILLPNNKNIILTAGQVQHVSSKNVTVVPSKTIPQGVAALLAFNYDLGTQENAKAMTDVLKSVTTLEVTRAVRKTEMDDVKVKKGEFIVIKNDKELLSAGDDLIDVVLGAVQKSGIAAPELVTLYAGVESDPAVSESLSEKIRELLSCEVELVDGGQPHYDFIISIE